MTTSLFILQIFYTGIRLMLFARGAGGMFAEVFSEVRFHYSGLAIPSLRYLSFGAIRSRHLLSLGKG